MGTSNGFKLFDQNLALTAGRPFLQQPDGSVIKTTEMLALNIYSAFYSRNRIPSTPPSSELINTCIKLTVISGYLT